MSHDIVAFDPGNHTGISWKDPDGSYGTYMIFEDLPRVYTYIINKPRLVVVEQFYTPGKIDRHGLYTKQLIGGILALCWHLKIPCVEHQPGPPKPLVEKARLWHKQHHLSYTPHHLDALAHLWLYEEQLERNSNVQDATAAASSKVSGRSVSSKTPNKAFLDHLRSNKDLH